MNTLLQIPWDRRSVVAAQDRERPRILVVDDDEILREFNAAVLARAGYEVDVAEDGVAAWEALQTRSYDMLITDNDMPRMTGIDLVQELRSAGMELPVIMASGSLRELAQNAWLESVSTLAKPYSPGQLLGTVKNLLQLEEGLAAHAVGRTVCVGRSRPRWQH